uniref:Sister chromatid cohesion protein PDS5 B n=1 Tax=Ascaris suum TaxID=6253 RepID=F1KQH1_ASCSU
MNEEAIEYPPGCQPISLASNNHELIKRLRALDGALKEAETNESIALPNRYASLMEHLSRSQLLNNPCKEVQILLACCIANLMRIFAPESPIGDPHLLKEVLIFLVRNLDGLADPTNPLYHRYVYLLENLSVTETLQLAIHLGDNAQPVLRQLIKTGFGAMNDKNSEETNLRGILSTMCSKLVQSVDQVSNSVLDAVLFFLVPPQKMNNRESYRMARDLIISNRDSVEPAIQLLLSHAIRSGELLDCDLITHKKIFNVIYELHEFEPDIIYPVLPLLVPNLSVAEVDKRRETTVFFGNLLSSERSKLADVMPELWKEFKSRFSDVDRDIRIICVKKAEDLLVFHPEYAGQVTELVMARCRDLDETVRLETVRMVKSLARRKFSAVSEKLLACVAERIRDKKTDVRHETVISLSALFRAIYTDERFAESERASVLVIFNAILVLYCQPLQQDRVLIEKVFVSNLVSFKVPVSQRVQILIDTFLCVGVFGAKAYDEILARQSRMRRQCRRLLELIDAGNVEETKAKIDSRIQALAEFSAEPAKATQSFRVFAQFLARDSRSSQLLKYVLGDSYTCGKIEGCLTELFSRMRDQEDIPKEDVSNVQSVLERAAPLQIDAEAVRELMQKVHAMMQKAFLFGDATILKNIFRLNSLLRVMVENYPRCFLGDAVMKLFAKLLDFEDRATTENTLKVIKLASPRVEEDSDEEEKRAHSALLEMCNSIAREGNPRAAKLAVRCIVAMLNESDGHINVDEIVEESIAHLDLDDRLCATAFRALGSAVEAYPETYKTRFESLIMKKVAEIVLSEDVDEVISAEESGTNVESELDVEGKKALYDRESSKHNVGDKCVTKLMGLKFMCVFLVAQASHLDKTVESLASRTLKMMSTFVKSAGDIFAKPTSDMEKAQLRAMAGCCMLKLASCRDYGKLVTVDEFIALSPLIYDDVVFVRWRFVSRLLKHLDSMKLSIEYMGLLSLVALVDDKEFKAKVRIILEKNITIRRKFLGRPETQPYAPYHQPEYCIAYAVYVLSKFTSFATYTDEATLSTLRGCLWFLMELFQSNKDPKNMEFIRTMLQEIKNCGDATMQEGPGDVEEQDKKMWALCDVGILLLSYRTKLNLGGGTEKRPVLSKRFFVRYQSKKGVEIYVPESMIEEEKRGMKQNRAHGEGSMMSMRSDKSRTRLTKKEVKKTRPAKGDEDGHSEGDDIEISEGDVLEAGGSGLNAVEPSRPTGKSVGAGKVMDGLGKSTDSPAAAALFTGITESVERGSDHRATRRTAVRSIASNKAKQQLSRSNGLISVIEEEAPSRSPSKSPCKAPSIESTASTSQEAVAGTSRSPARKSTRAGKAKAELREAVANISPILPHGKATRPTKRIFKKHAISAAFISSTPVAGLANRKRSQPRYRIGEVREEQTEPSPSKRRKIDEEDRQADRPARDTAQRLRRGTVAARQYSPELPSPKKMSPQKASNATVSVVASSKKKQTGQNGDVTSPSTTSLKRSRSSRKGAVARLKKRPGRLGTVVSASPKKTAAGTATAAMMNDALEDAGESVDLFSSIQTEADKTAKTQRSGKASGHGRQKKAGEEEIKTIDNTQETIAKAADETTSTPTSSFGLEEESDPEEVVEGTMRVTRAGRSKEVISPRRGSSGRGKNASISPVKIAANGSRRAASKLQRSNEVRGSGGSMTMPRKSASSRKQTKSPVKVRGKIYRW